MGKTDLLTKFLFVSSVFLCLCGNAAADIVVNKTIAGGTTQPAAENDFVFYDIEVTNTSGALSNIVIDDNLDNDLNNFVFLNAPLGGSQTGATQFTIPNMSVGQSTTLNVRATVNSASTCPVIENSVDVSEGSGTFNASDSAPDIEYDFELTSGLTSNVITHLANSFCELCGDGTVTLRISNPTTAVLTNITIVEDLQTSGLTYIPGSTTVTSGSASNPSISGTQLTWTSAQLSALNSLAAGESVDITFGVRRLDEGLISADRRIFATMDFDMSCLSARQSFNAGQFEVPINQPEPIVLKDAINFDAGQSDYSDPIYGNENDDVIWRVNVRNAGDANIEALRINDSIDGNFSINSICSTEAEALAVANSNGVNGGSCIAMTSPFNVVDPFGNATNPDDIAANTNDAFVYYVGRILAAHTNNTNTSDVSWGCNADSPAGGLLTTPATNNGVLPTFDIDETGDLSTTVVPSNLVITQTVTGSNISQPLGSKGLVTVVIDNQTGGSIKNLELQNIVPNGYVVDGSYGSQSGSEDCDCTVTFDPAYGLPGTTYPGFIDTVVRDDAERDNGDPLDDLTPHFTFTSSTVGADANQVDLLRHGDVITLTFGIVMIDPVLFDVAADLELSPEASPATDPTNALALSSTATVDFDAVDVTNGLQNQSENDVFNFNSNPEDLDVAISDALFILTNDPGTPLTLNVLLTNNGGHDADDYTTYVSFGQAMTVETAPTGCTGPVTNPPVQPHWNDPSDIPATAAVYACDRGVIAPGDTETFSFTVTKTNAAAEDDLTFRADVFGEVTLFDGSLLTFPSPPTIPDTSPNVAQRANNYSFDAVRSKVLGFNLVKSAWYCAEDGLAEPAVPANILTEAAAAPNSPSLTGNLNSQIGEDCTYRIESGGWFGFETPGFTLIAVEDVVVTDDLPDGQGFIPYSGGQDYNFTNTADINLEGVNGGAGTTPLDETDISWSFNVTGPGILEKDKFFRVDFKTRLLNDPVDLDYPVPGSYAPNLHSNISTNVARTQFVARFDSDIGNDAITVNDSAGIPGYPVASIRTVDLTEVEPNLIVTKQVCNETLNGFGTGCSLFADSINDGDTDDSYIYRITLENQTSTPTRSPAFNVISTDTLDVSDLMLVVNFASDGLDNDGDTQVDEADEATLFASIPDNIVGNGTPAVITVNESFNALLQQVNPGAVNRITFYYRVNPDDSIAPLQSLTNTVSMSFDSLEGNTGNQLTLPLANSTVAPDDVGRARIYTSIAQTANVQMIPLQAQPKAVVEVSNSILGGSPQGVVIGEEVRYQLTTLLPVTNLRNFVIRDRLPAGMRCVENGPVVVMGPGGPHADAGFIPATNVTPVCSASGDEIVWDFGDRELTMAGGASRFPFVIEFVARVDNVDANRDGTVLKNGGGAGAGGTDVTASYENEAGATIVLDFDPVDVVVQEPDVALTKSFAVANSDAGDVLTVTVTATNTGSAAAYNLRVLDDLVGSDMTFIPGSLSGTDPPDNVDFTQGVNKPTFSWNELDGGTLNPEYEIPASGGVRSFTFDVRVDTSAQPLEILDNTIHAKWDSLPGQSTALNASNLIGVDGSATGLRNGVLPNDPGDTLNDYETTASASNSVLPLTLNKSDLNPGLIPAIGAHKNFEIEVSLPEGTTNNLVVVDDLISSGLSYALSRNATFDVSITFNGIATINGLAPSEAAFTGQGLGTLPVDNDTGVIEWNIGTVVTQEEDDATLNAVNPSIVINYFARVNNDLVTDDTDTLQNSVTVTYNNGESAATETLIDTTAVQTVVEPSLVVSKTVTNTSGEIDISVGDILEFRIELDNTAGTSTAFDVNIVDTLPAFLLLDNGFTPTASLVPSGVPVAGFNASPAGAPAGPLLWGRGNADNSLDVPAGQTIVLKYQTVVQPGTPPDADIVNSAIIDWTSLDDTDVSSAFERTGGVACPVITLPNDYCTGPVEAVVITGQAEALFKANPVDQNISIGEEFSYTITIPEIPQGTALFDVQVLDNLAVSTADLGFVSVTKVPDALPWQPVNTGTPSDLIIKDVTNGIDIPAGEQIEMLVTVVLKDTPVRNVDTVGFSNTATYNFNSINNDDASVRNGSGNTTPALTIVEPELILDKRGPAGNVVFGAPIPYQIVVENIGTGPAFDATVIDRLPNVPDNPAQQGGTCDVSPTNFNARITSSVDEATLLRDLIRDTDYTASYTPAPDCELVITTLTDKARIEANEKIIIDYETTLDVGSESSAELTNIAAVTQWFSLDTAGAGATGEIREYTRLLTDGTPADANDHEDSFTVTVEASVLTFQKTVSNITTGTTPGADASPGDTIRYSIVVTNTGPVSLDNFSITDEVDRLVTADAFFVPGSMTNFNIPAGADNSNTNINGGANNAGLLDVRNLSIDAAGGLNDSVLIEFDVTLLPVITSNTIVVNQASLTAASVGTLLSDDPLIGGLTDPTETLISSAPLFQVQKTSQDMTGDVNLLQAGDTLRYTLTVKNIGQEDSVNTLISDQIPANTTYVANTTTLNGVLVADTGAGVSALTGGLLINAPENSTNGYMRADSDSAATNTATITFDVTVNPSSVDGTIISNQGFVSGSGAGSGVFPQQPSDDPTTTTIDDPTIDIVGDVALFDVQKTVALVGDINANGIVDPGDVLRYSITATNFGGKVVTNAILTDAVPASTQYVANSTTLNGIAVSDPSLNVSPLISGIAISSSDLTPPLPLSGDGVLSAGQSAVIVFDVTVDGAAVAGTVISNQGFVSSNELATEPTDADGIDSNGDQPTDVVVGSSPSLLITKQVFVVGSGEALAGGELEYVVRVTNNGTVPVTNVVITDDLGVDDLGLPVPGQKTYVANSALLNGLPTGVSVVGDLITADYSTTYGNLAPTAFAELRFRVLLSSSLNIGETISNTADVVWNIPPETASATVTIDIGGVPGAVNLNGQVWHDVNFDNTAGAGETLLPDWDVSLYRNNQLIANTLTDVNGQFKFSGLQPNLASGIPSGDAYEIRYLAPGATATTATLGNASSSFTNVPQGINNILAISGSSVQNLNLPIQPNGVVYNSVQRTEVSGVRLTMINQTRSNNPVPASCFTDPIQADQLTNTTGWYKFDLNFSDPSRCAEGDEYEIQVLPPADNFVGTTSAILPPVNPVTGPAQDIINCPATAADQIPATPLHCENSASVIPSVAASTASVYALKFLFNSTPVRNQIFNNHIPVDPDLGSAVAISKVAGMHNVTRSQLVPYTITVTNTLSVPLNDLSVVDTFPAGFKYISGSSRLDKAEVEPVRNGRQLTWNIPTLNVGDSKEIKLLLVAGSGVSEGEYVNTAQMFNNRTGGAASGIASATVRIIPDPTFDCTDVIGKVFDDKNMNAYQDEGEKGIKGIQVATARGLRVTTDRHGRFHIACALVPNETRGSNFIMKLDDRSLPSGYRVTTENPRVQRATRGKMLKFNFGAALHRVVKLDLADAVFVKGSSELRPQWRSRIDILISELVKSASILRLSYLAENESESDVDERLDAIETLISDKWEGLDCCYNLTIEKEVYWRKGYPSERGVFE